MTVERKTLQQKPERKKEDNVNVKKLKRGFKVNELPDAIVDQKFVGQVGDEIVVERFRNGKNTFSVCTVKQVDEAGLIHTWDETLQQWFVFPSSQSPKTTKLFISKGKQ